MAKFGNYDIQLEKSDEKGMLDLQIIKHYLTKAENAICKIKLSKGYGTGFFCKIPFTENFNLLLPVLITCNHVLSKDIIESENYIEIIVEEEKKRISLKDQRKKWTSEDLDFTAIEILNNDNIDEFFYLDDNVFKKNYSNNIYLDKKVIIFGINENGKPGFSNGKIKSIQDFSFAYNCNTYPGCSGGCIVNQINNCVIGIHRGEIKTQNNKAINAGLFIWNAINLIKDKKDTKELINSPLNYYSEEKMTAFIRLKKEFTSLTSNPLSNIGCTVSYKDKNDLFTWIIALFGPKDTSYRGGLFFLKAYFPDNYPSEPPEICFITPVYHVNINPRAPRSNGGERLGYISISTLNCWKPEFTMRKAITDIFILFYSGNPECPYCLDRADEMLNNRKLFEEKVKYFTNKYANPFKFKFDYKKYEEYDKDWDFNYPF